MDSFERDIKEQLSALPPDWRARTRGMREEVRFVYEEKRKKAAMLAWIGSGIGVSFLLLGALCLPFGFLSGNVSITVIGAMVFLFGDGWITGSKLLYWTWNSRIRLERDLKEVHADVLELSSRLERIEAAVCSRKGGADGGGQTP